MTSGGSTVGGRSGIGATRLAILIAVVAIVAASSACAILYYDYMSQGKEMSGLRGTISSLQQQVAILELQLNALQEQLNITGPSQSVSITQVTCETNVCGIELVGLRENVSVTGIQIGNTTFTTAGPLCRCEEACPLYMLAMPIHLQQGVAFDLSESVNLAPGQSVVVRVLADDGSVASAMALVGNGTCIP